MTTKIHLCSWCQDELYFINKHYPQSQWTNISRRYVKLHVKLYTNKCQLANFRNIYNNKSVRRNNTVNKQVCSIVTTTCEPQLHATDAVMGSSYFNSSVTMTFNYLEVIKLCS